MKDALAIHRMLLELEAMHEIVLLPRAITSADELPEVLGLPAERCLAVRLFTYGGMGTHRPLVAVVVRARDVAPATAVRSVLGEQTARVAPADLVNTVTGYAAELVAPLLLPDDVTVFLDQEIIDGRAAYDVVYTATGECGTALGIHAYNLFNLCGAKPIDLRLCALSPAQVSCTRQRRSRDRRRAVQ